MWNKSVYLVSSEESKRSVNRLWVCSENSGKTVTMLKSTALVVHLVHIVLLTTSAVYRWWLVDIRLIVVRLFQVKKEMCKRIDLHGESRGDCAHYWFTEIKI